MILLCMLVYTSRGNAQTLPDSILQTFPGIEWQELSQSWQRGWDTAKLRELRRFTIDSTYITGLVIIYNGKILASFGDTAEISLSASVRKSILSILFGPFVENGKINLYKTLAQLNFNDKGGLLPLEKEATIYDLMTSRAGIFRESGNPVGDEVLIALQRGSKKPGSFFLYNNWGFNAAGVIFEKETGMNSFDAVDSILAKPLEMQDWKREKQAKRGDTTNTVLLTYSMQMSTRDMARIGYLMLRKGKWKDRQIISEQWIKQITGSVTSYKEIMQYEPRTKPIPRMGKGYPVPGLGYGITWWIWDPAINKHIYQGAYTAWGYRGQFITVLPKLDVVVAIKTKDVYQRVTSWEHFSRFLELLIAAKTDQRN